MRIILPGVLFFILLSQNIFSQSEQEAIKILDKFSSGALGAPSVSMRFDLVKFNQMEKSTDTVKGSIILSKDKYVLNLTDNITWFNGETAWSYLPAEKEVTITKPDRRDNSFKNKPSAIFSLYKKGYKNRLIEENAGTYTIDLYPEDIKSDLLRVRLSIGKPGLDLKSLEYKQRDGIVITIYIKEYNLKVKPESDTFVFQQSKFQGVEVVDMR